MGTASNSSFVTRDLPLSADLMALQRRHPDRYPFLLESVAHGTLQGRYDILFAFPGAQLVSDADGTCANQQGTLPGENFFTLLDEQWRRARVPNLSLKDAPPFRGGWFLYLGYELAALIEPGLKLTLGSALPAAFAVRVPAAIFRDSATGVITLLAEAAHHELLEAMQEDLCTKMIGMPAPATLLLSPLHEERPGPYLDSVERARRYILDGDIFQANLSRGWHTQTAVDVTPADIYQRLRQANPAPFAGLALFGDTAIISSSPERLVSIRNGRIDARPIAGTRPRHANAEKDAALIRELIGHPKERAEHVMLLDLERNDLGRIARTGSVRVDELMVIESYAHVHHIVSNVCAELREDVTPGAVIRAVFPGGTITGCPKVRCMEIIAELEQAPREAYTGSMGYLNCDGDMDLNILIRSLLQKADRLEFRAGAGIVADSIPERELDETRAKARGMARALGVHL